MAATVEKMRGPERTEQVTVRLTATEKDTLRRIAIQRGLHLEQVVRHWIASETTMATTDGTEAA